MDYFIYTIIGLIVLFILLWQISNLIALIFGSPSVNSKKMYIYEALKFSRLRPGEVFYDLGCGSGHSLLEAAKLGAKAIGFEISPAQILIAKLRTLLKKNIKVRMQNILKVNLREADVIYCYLLPGLIKKLEKKIKKEMRRSSRVVLLSFPFPNLKPSSVKKLAGKTLYLYKF